jgi:hypothetical protein
LIKRRAIGFFILREVTFKGFLFAAGRFSTIFPALAIFDLVFVLKAEYADHPTEILGFWNSGISAGFDCIHKQSRPFLSCNFFTHDFLCLIFLFRLQATD